MQENPLASPRDGSVLQRFAQHFELSSPTESAPGLTAVVRAFAQIPYENLTKIIKQADAPSIESARRHPSEVVDDHIRWRAGGTCFSLTSALLYLIRSLG